MTDDTNNTNAANAQGNGNNPPTCYEVVIGRTDLFRWMIRLEAASEKEAEDAAMKLAELQDDMVWHIADKDFIALDVREVKGGKGHE